MKRLMGWTLKALLVFGVIAGIQMIFSSPEERAAEDAKSAAEDAAKQKSSGGP